MVGRIERLRRQFPARAIAPMLVLAIAIPRPDPTKRVGGTAGVIAMPSVAAPTASTNAHGDLIPVESRRDTRADRGRVLYAKKTVSRDSTAAAKQPCAEQRLVARGSAPAPTI